MLHTYQKPLNGDVGVTWTINCIYGWYNWSKLNKSNEQTGDANE